jgi:hypothetical protein
MDRLTETGAFAALMLVMAPIQAATLDIPEKLSGSTQQSAKLNTNFAAVEKAVNSTNNGVGNLRTKIQSLKAQVTLLAESIDTMPTAGEFTTLAVRVTDLEGSVNDLAIAVDALAPHPSTPKVRRRSDNNLLGYVLGLGLGYTTEGYLFEFATPFDLTVRYLAPNCAGVGYVRWQDFTSTSIRAEIYGPRVATNQLVIEAGATPLAGTEIIESYISAGSTTCTNLTSSIPANTTLLPVTTNDPAVTGYPLDFNPSDYYLAFD